MPAFFFFNTLSPPQTLTTKQQEQQQKFLKHFFVGSRAAGLTLRGKQKTLVARRLEQPQLVCPTLLCLFKEPIQKSNMQLGLASPRRSCDLGMGVFIVFLNKMGCLVWFLRHNFFKREESIQILLFF